jgi:hypothetical protein
MSVAEMTSKSQLLLIAGIVLVAAAIAGGGVSWKDFSIPKVLSRQRQYLLGAFGAFLFLTGLGIFSADLGHDFIIVWAIAIIGGFIAMEVRNKKYEKLSKEHLGRPDKLIEDAKDAFWASDYKWTIRFALQAKGAARDESWQGGYAFLLGARLALRQKDAASTRIEIVNSIKKAAEDKTGYFSSMESLQQLVADLAAIKSKIARDNMAESYAGPVRAEIDLVIQAAK